MNAIRNLPGPSLYEPEDHRTDLNEAIDSRAKTLEEQYLADPKARHDIDVGASELLDYEQHEDTFSALADLADVDAERLIGSDALARVLRIADDMKAMRIKRLKEVAMSDAEDQVKNWSAYA